MFDSRRRRRVLYNDDSDQQYLRMPGAPKTKYVQQQPAFKYVVPDAQAFIDARTTPVFDTHVDTYIWCLGNGSDPAWGGTRPFAAGMKSNQQATDLIVEACHARGLEVWGSLRMNDIHDASRATSLEAADDPMKARYPDWLLRPPDSKDLPESFSEHYQWTAFNFDRPEVREYRLAFIEKSASQHDFDGYELDFTRFAWYLPLGTERQKAHIMTGLVRQVRSRLNAIGRSRGRPITLAVHVFDSPGAALNLGLDVENWVDDGLVDVLVVGTGYRHYSLRLGEWLDLAEPYSVPVYPSVNTNTYLDWVPTLGNRIHTAALRAVASHYWQEGADGIYLFNHFSQVGFRELGSGDSLEIHEIYDQLSEVGDPAVLRGKDKLYGFGTPSEQAMHQQATLDAPLPVPLDSTERVLPIKMGADATDTRADSRIRAWTTGGNEGESVWFRLNHVLLDATRSGAWIDAPVPHGVFRTGDNVLGVWCDRDLVEITDPTIIHRLFVEVSYG